MTFVVFFFQAEDGIRDLVRSRGLGDVYKRQDLERGQPGLDVAATHRWRRGLTAYPAPESGPLVHSLSLIHISEPTRPY